MSHDFPDNNIVLYLKTISKQIKPALNLKDSGVYGGSFGIKEVKRVAANAPCAFIALLEIPPNKSTSCTGKTHFISPVVFIITEGKDKSTDAMTLAANAKEWIQGSRFDQDYATTAKDVRAKNMYSDALDQIGINVWALNFSTKIVNT